MAIVLLIRHGPKIIELFFFMFNSNYVLLNITEHETFSANKHENANYCWHFSYLLTEKNSCSAELNMKKSFIISGPGILKSVSILLVPYRFCMKSGFNWPKGF